MDKKTLKEIKAKLIQEKKDLERGLIEFTTKDKNLAGDYDTRFPDYGSHMDENAAEVTTYDTDLSVEANLELLLEAVNKALAKIKKKNFGFCEKCNKAIEVKRLLAFPAARFCINCMKKEKSSYV